MNVLIERRRNQKTKIPVFSVRSHTGEGNNCIRVFMRGYA